MTNAIALSPGVKGAITRMVNKDFDNLDCYDDEAMRLMDTAVSDNPDNLHIRNYVDKMRARLSM